VNCSRPVCFARECAFTQALLVTNGTTCCSRWPRLHPPGNAATLDAHEHFPRLGSCGRLRTDSCGSARTRGVLDEPRPPRPRPSPHSGARDRDQPPLKRVHERTSHHRPHTRNDHDKRSHQFRRCARRPDTNIGSVRTTNEDLAYAAAGSPRSARAGWARPSEDASARAMEVWYVQSAHRTWSRGKLRDLCRDARHRGDCVGIGRERPIITLHGALAHSRPPSPSCHVGDACLPACSAASCHETDPGPLPVPTSSTPAESPARRDHPRPRTCSCARSAADQAATTPDIHYAPRSPRPLPSIHRRLWARFHPREIADPGS